MASSDYHGSVCHYCSYLYLASTAIVLRSEYMSVFTNDMFANHCSEVWLY